MRTIDYLAAAKQRLGIESDYRLSKELGISKSVICRYKKQHGFFDDEIALRVAKLLEIDPAIVLADIYAERTNNEEIRSIWKRVGKYCQTVAAAMLLSFLVFSTVPPVTAHAVAGGAGAVCILCKIGRRRRTASSQSVKLSAASITA